MTHVSFVCSEPLKKTMAGIGIRYTELATIFCDLGFEVTLYSPLVEDVGCRLPSNGRIRQFEASRLSRSDVMVVQGHLTERVLDCRRHVPVVVDLYDPFLIENMNYAETLGEEVFARDFETWKRIFVEGDFFLSASEEQRIFYLGALTASGRVSPVEIRHDPTLRSLIDNLPFGLPDEIPAHERYLGETDDERFNILFGGLYDWYDPWTVLEALDHDAFDRFRLIFVRNPNPELTPQRLFREVEAWCTSRHWNSDKVEFIEWVPSNRRFDLLRDVDLLVAPHPDTLESRLSMRTRFIEAIAVGCPVIASSGGAVSQLIEKYQGGGVVAPGDVQGLRALLREAVSGSARLKISPENRRRFLTDFSLRNLAQPLARFCSAPRRNTRSTAVATPHRIERASPVPQSDHRSFSVLMPTHNRMDILPEVLNALEQQRGAPDFDLVIVDDGSTDGTSQWLQTREFRYPVKLINQDNQGPATARNRAVEHAKSEYLVLLGDDTVPDRFWLKHHVDAHSRRGYEPGLVVVGQTDWHRSIRRSAFLDFLDDSGWQFAFDKIEDPEDVDFNFFYGSNLSLPRECLLKEPFNTDFPYPAWEDTELGYRLKLEGSRFVFEPGARTYHCHRTSIARLAARQSKAGYCAAVFCRLHPELESFVWPSEDSLRNASGPAIRLARKWMAGVLDYFPIELANTWNRIFRDHYVMGIRRYLEDHGVPGHDPASILPSQLFPIHFDARSPLLKHSSGSLVDGAWSCRVGRDKPAHCVYGPYLAMHVSCELEVRFYIRVERQDGDNLNVATLDVYEDKSRTVLAESVLRVNDAREYGYASLRFVSAPGQNLEFRVFWHGNHALGVERLELHRVGM